MKFRTIITAVAAMATSVAIAAPVHLVELDTKLPTNSGFSNIAWDEANQCWTMTGINNNFGTIRPAVLTKPLTSSVDESLEAFCFDYKCDRPVGALKMTVYKASNNGSRTTTHNFTITMPASSEWKTVRIDVSAERAAYRTKLGLVNQYLEIQFTDLVSAESLSLRNVRFEADEQPLKSLTIMPGKVNILEAEDFNLSTKGKGHTSRQTNRAVLSKYIDPYPGQFPIYAFTSVSFETVGEGVHAWNVLLQKKYKDLWEAGFNITEGTAYSGVDVGALFTDETVNGDDPMDFFEGTGLKMIIRAGLEGGERAHVVERAKQSPRLAGYCVKDEPHCGDFGAMRDKLNAIRDLDDTRLLYGNLLHINTVPSAIGATSYDNYVDRYINETNMGFLSYDYYAVRQFENTDESTEANTKLMPNFFMNLEVISKFAKAYNTKFWAFTRAMSSTWHATGMENSVMEPYPYKYPAPKEEHMRVQAFSALMYGAQGLQYWPYMSCDGCNDAPIQRDGTKNPAWYYAKNINTDVKALTWVFLGAEMLRVGHTNATTPVGCLRLTTAMLPDGIGAVTTDGDGMPVSVLQNEKNVFMMALNPQLFRNQKLTVNVTKNMKRVLMDGTTENVVPGTYNFDLKPGEFVLYLTDENAPALDKYYTTPGEHSDYRDDATDVAITADSKASNGYYLSDMGLSNWNVYGGITPQNESRAISEADAQNYWGSKYNYTVDVAEDTPVNISIGHSINWADYGRAAAYGAKPGLSYTIEGNPTLNWTKQYAGAMRLYIDGEPLTPSNQATRPAVPEVFTEDGAEFNRILADKSQWVPTTNADGSASDILYLWPKAGGNNNFETTYNELPDYQSVMLTAGTHKITVESLSSPWHFDNIKLDTQKTSGIDAIVNDNANAPVEWYNLQGMRINPETATPGLYLRRQGNKTDKVAL
ncbi:MAG: hypothetical protein NC343_03230 [Muribaculum sp.]|nr:hypothetical protein [Muribaculaceae bacterium]MCM1080740.1 hypothetical protein [Muribaculum sp.]